MEEITHANHLFFFPSVDIGGEGTEGLRFREKKQRIYYAGVVGGGYKCLKKDKMTLNKTREKEGKMENSGPMLREGSGIQVLKGGGEFNITHWT